ncbi:hypothetical protein H310_07980 [Aphanomyces invadans]|uniref:Uncharacterized protein n=1 Tax=Aphanomyces invadans TaxID=157072 RepID=A0A024TZW4_9STRA|nr:hypothetical protein H310_07980 [Aphanomyces invadans]ETV99186.1 hypothetical protein H310_07980 [Aphanomyces invadans]|eukprot:XP_008871742.1 hypothetical protein H310_07980 [Aphanomyces invadans]
MRVVFCVLAAAAAAVTTDKANDELWCNATISKRVMDVPTTSPLQFCTRNQDARCCLPIHDTEISTTYFALMEAGRNCRQGHNMAAEYLKSIFCAACRPTSSTYLSNPINVAFFSGQTFKICRDLAVEAAPIHFADCGFVYVGDRQDNCKPSVAIAPKVVFPGCKEGQHVCYGDQGRYTSAWYCSSNPCGSDTPAGFRDVPCSGETCSDTLMFFNDNRGGKPVFFEGSAVEIIDQALCPPSNPACCLPSDIPIYEDEGGV